VLLQYPGGKPGCYEIPTGVTNLWARSMRFCNRLTSVTIPSSVTRIYQSTLGCCAALTNISVNGLNPAYSSRDGVLFDKNGTVLIQWPFGRLGRQTVPDGTTNLFEGSFWSCTNLDLTLPSTVALISSVAFVECKDLDLYFCGNPPTLEPDAFLDAVNVRIHYLPGATGWEPAFGNFPTSLWRPVLQSDPGSVSRTNRFEFNVDWAAGMTVVVEAASSLKNPTWVPLQTNTLTSASLCVADPQWTNYPSRFYRVRRH